MDTSEATKVLMSRIQSLDPESSTKIMGVILIQDEGEKHIIRLAQSSDAILLSCINQVKICLGINPSSHSSDASNAIRPKNPFSLSSPRISIPNDGFHLSNPSPPADAFPRISPKPVSYASLKNGAYTSGNSSANSFSGSSSLSLFRDEFGEKLFSSGGGGAQVRQKVHDQLILDDSMGDPIISPSGKSDSLILAYGEDFKSSINFPHSNPLHRRSCSVNDASFLANLEEGSAGSEFGWTPCMYFGRGFCKNGSSCKFIHSDSDGVEAIEVGSPCRNFSGIDEFLRMKAIQQQSLALMASGSHFPHGGSKRVNFLNENQRSGATALMTGDNFQKINRYPLERNVSISMGLGTGENSSSRQIYLTFPADITFKEEDVSDYFSNFGPVQDVRIPYQQKRMFGFVTFAFPETVKLILAKGNPHFVCESRVLVKPYKEKGTIPDKRHHRHIELGEYAASLSPMELDLREHLDIAFGPRMLLNSQETMLRRKMEQEAELQHAVELQGRRMMNLRLMDLKNQPQMHNFFPVSSPRRSQLINQNLLVSCNAIDQEVSRDDDGGQEAATSQAITADDWRLAGGTKLAINNDPEGANNQEHIDEDESDISKSLDYTLPDNLFASPSQFAAENRPVLFPASDESSKFCSPL